MPEKVQWKSFKVLTPMQTRTDQFDTLNAMKSLEHPAGTSEISV